MARELKKTPLWAVHRRAGARMVDFAGWEMPVQYRGVIEEHLAVRERAGLFDVSHMGEIEIHGAGASEFCQRMTANDISRMKVSQAQYNLILNDAGGVVDDVIFYRLEPDRYLVCVNAANREKDFEWLRERAGGGVRVEDRSDDYALLALQGPAAEKILRSLTALDLQALKPFHFARAEVASIDCLLARTGYTGEDGFELYCNPQAAAGLWDRLLEAGASAGLEPAGLGARDTLRLEKAYPLYSHELDDTTTPLEAGLDWVVKLGKGEFVGRDVLLKQKEEGVRRRLVGLELMDPGIARADYPLLKDGRVVGRITSGTLSPSLKRAIALGYVTTEQAVTGNILEVEIRGRRARIQIVPVPFYRRSPS
ncbi:MAG TPA: glycine cleavage system aminomethyltransferase GcvT [candidate division Zixibacteria bacterium]|nr:glycine cleavage system aminomethyltransferase GcvT [candidate division Zixibacteria bacterium]